ncbi:MAG: antibiotic biosynthesis monooxygenase [Bacteroidota bacterium]
MQNLFTVVVSHFVKPGKEKAFEEALKRVIQKAKDYEGYEGIQTIQLSNKVENEYMLLVRFDTEPHYQTWAASATRRAWVQELKEYITRKSEVRCQEGLEFWFSLPHETAPTPPKKWKMALLTWMVIYPSVLGLSTLVGFYLGSMPLFLRMLLVSIILVSLMTYIIMPKITSLFASWIFKEE